jgi:hypothetical protein
MVSSRRYRFLRYLSIEAGFTDFGSKTLSPTVPLTVLMTNSATIDARDTRIDMKGAYWAIGGSYPIKNWEPYVKLGAIRAETDTSTRFVSCFCGPGVVNKSRREFDESTSSTSTETMYAIGLRYAIVDHYVIALEATLIPKVGDAEVTGEGDLRSLSLAFQYRF